MRQESQQYLCCGISGIDSGLAEVGYVIVDMFFGAVLILMMLLGRISCFARLRVRSTNRWFFSGPSRTSSVLQIRKTPLRG